MIELRKLDDLAELFSVYLNFVQRSYTEVNYNTDSLLYEYHSLGGK